MVTGRVLLILHPDYVTLYGPPLAIPGYPSRNIIRDKLDASVEALGSDTWYFAVEVCYQT